MPLRPLALTAAVVLLATSAVANAQTPPKPLRTLVYSVQYAEQTKNSEHTSGFTGAGGAIASGNASVDRTQDVADDGTLTIDVIAATADGGLVVDAAYAGKSTQQPKLRVAILSDGALGYDPKITLSPEAARVLPLLARGFIAGRDVSPGTAWTVKAPQGATGDATWSVAALDGQNATLALKGTLNVAGPRGFNELDTGTVTYATDRLCPLAFDLHALSHHQPSAEQYVTSNLQLSAKLVSDSFAKK